MYAVSSFLSSPLVSAFRQPRLRLSDCQVWESQRLLRPLQRDPKAESKVKLQQQMQESLNPKRRQRPLFPLKSSQNVYPERRTQEGCGENKRIHPETDLFKYLLARQAFMQAMLCIYKKKRNMHTVPAPVAFSTDSVRRKEIIANWTSDQKVVGQLEAGIDCRISQRLPVTKSLDPQSNCPRHATRAGNAPCNASDES